MGDLDKVICKLEKRDLSQTSSVAIVAKLQYLASVLDQEMMLCFLEPQVTKLLPKNA